MTVAIPMPGNDEGPTAVWQGLESPRPSPASEAMDRYAAGDTRAFETVFDEIAPEIERFFDGRVDSVVGGELTAKTFVTMHRLRGTFIRGSAVLPWALAIAERLLRETR